MHNKNYNQNIIKIIYQMKNLDLFLEKYNLRL